MSKSTQFHHRDVNNILPGLCSIPVLKWLKKKKRNTEHANIFTHFILHAYMLFAS